MGAGFETSWKPNLESLMDFVDDLAREMSGDIPEAPPDPNLFRNPLSE